MKSKNKTVVTNAVTNPVTNQATDHPPVPIDRARVGDVVEIGGVRCRVVEVTGMSCYCCIGDHPVNEEFCQSPWCIADLTADGLSYIYRPIQ